MSTEPITPFQGDGEKENPEDFLRSFFRKMGTASDDVKRQQFPNYLQADSTVDTWFEELTEKEKKDWSLIEAAFRKRWPRKKAVKKTQEEYEEEITTLKLRMEDLGKKEKVAGRDVYSHIAWADKMGSIVRGAKLEETTTYIGSVRRQLPTLLREKLGAGHTNWTEFLQAIRDIDIDYIRDGVDIWKKEQADQEAVNQRIQKLEKLTASSTVQLQHQLSALSISSPSIARSTSLPNPQQTNNIPLATPVSSSGQENPFQRRTMTPYPPRPPPTQADRDALRVQLAKYPQHPDTDAGRQAHQAQQADWVRTYRLGTRVTESTPYPLRPGTAPINSGECFTCGFIGHFGQRGNSSNCSGRRPLHVNEQHWRSICSRILKEPRSAAAANMNLVEVDDYGTVYSTQNQGNGEGSLA